ncbi:unnamed protein product, partial [Symbiodinium natans]
MEVNSQYSSRTGPPQPALSSSTCLASQSGEVESQPTTGSSGILDYHAAPTTDLFQPVVLSPRTNAIMATAIVMGVNVNDQADMQQWLNSQITTRQQVLHTNPKLPPRGDQTRALQHDHQVDM